MVVDYQNFTTKDMPKEERKMYGVGDIWANQAKCLRCGDVVRSRNRHDFVSCSCGNLAVDGGSFYAKRLVRDGWDSIENQNEMYDDVSDED